MKIANELGNDVEEGVEVELKYAEKNPWVKGTIVGSLMVIIGLSIWFCMPKNKKESNDDDFKPIEILEISEVKIE